MHNKGRNERHKNNTERDDRIRNISDVRIIA